ncbi:MAG: hypothetical protein AAGF32_05690 [Pseudomonadota bacterium]
MAGEPTAAGLLFAQVALVEDLAQAPEVPLAQAHWLGDLAANRAAVDSVWITLATGEELRLPLGQPTFNDHLTAVRRAQDTHTPLFFLIDDDEETIASLQTPRADRLLDMTVSKTDSAVILQLEFDPQTAILAQDVWLDRDARDAMEIALSDNSVVFCARDETNAICELAVVANSALVTLDGQLEDTPGSQAARLSQVRMDDLFARCRAALVDRCVRGGPSSLQNARGDGSEQSIAEIVGLGPHFGRSDYRAHLMAGIADEIGITVGKIWLHPSEQCAGPGRAVSQLEVAQAAQSPTMIAAPYVYGPSGALRVIDPTLFNKPVPVPEWEKKVGLADAQRSFSAPAAITVSAGGEVRVEDWDASFTQLDELRWMERGLIDRQLQGTDLDLFCYARDMRDLRRSAT